ncbi:DsbA family protein [Phenylobacterium deserti]|uniref:DsbA family protein n=2 Tax=Phenylobacterium deserti TaxID=1914756 RepID=A0A328AX58_9CAUL|nr:DsbA family protein [Phenylobacterium deserti]
MSLGKASAPIKVVEYASLTCPHCATYNAEVISVLKSRYIDTGQVQFTLKELLTPPQTVAAAGFLMARCAGPDKYFKVVDDVFRSQSRWRAGGIRQVLLQIAMANGLTEPQFEACLKDEAQLDALEARIRKVVEEDGIESTPTIFVNGRKVEGHTLADLEAAIAAARK